MSLAFTGNYAPLILSWWRAAEARSPESAIRHPATSRPGDEIDIYSSPELTPDHHTSSFYPIIIGIMFIDLDCWGSVADYAEHYANKNRGLLQSFHFSLSLWSKLPNQTGVHPRQTIQLNSFITVSSKKWNGNRCRCSHVMFGNKLHVSKKYWREHNAKCIVNKIIIILRWKPWASGRQLSLLRCWPGLTWLHLQGQLFYRKNGEKILV